MVVTAPPLSVVRENLLRQVVPLVVAAVVFCSAVSGRFLQQIPDIGGDSITTSPGENINVHPGNLYSIM